MPSAPPPDGRTALQEYMNQLLPPLNSALNSLAAMPPADRPADPVRALSRLLSGSPSSVTPSRALASLLGMKKAEEMPLDVLCAMLLECGALRASSGSRPASPASTNTSMPDSPHFLGAEKRKLPGRFDSNDEITRLDLDGASDAGSEVAPNASRSSSGKKAWQRMLKPALRKGKSESNPWAIYEIHKQPTELCVRWDYNAEKDMWERSETLIKMERESFAHGAMRECYRMKKMSQVNAHFFFAMDWKDCNNYVAKRYINRDIPKETYFTDIQMQMVAKRYAKLYNTLHPPKGVDFLHAFVIEVERNGETLRFCVERAMEEGGYVKYNNNSGFVEYHAEGVEHAHRFTPHAFSRFTFFQSAGELMVVDIQGVDDVYTDPQIHTAGGKGYGEGNLGYGGMALFFSTSDHDSLCKNLKLPLMALSPNEKERLASYVRHETPRASATADDEEEAEGATGQMNPPAARAAARLSVVQALSILKSAEEKVKRRRSVTSPPVHEALAEASEEEERKDDELHAKDLPLALLGDDAAAAYRAVGYDEEMVEATEAIIPSFAGPGERRGEVMCCATPDHSRVACGSLCRGLSASEVLPGVCLAKADEAVLKPFLARVNAKLAEVGDLSALVELAQSKAECGELPQAVELMRAAVAKASTSNEQDSLGGCALYQCLEKLGHLQLANQDAAGASESFSEAAEAAMEAGKTKLAMRLSALAEEHACEEEM
ncbi:hypothetical protein AB1Y20_007576 [Prymnesium parvum]|uniref:Alpha-type protein kinase domain-containing protein n=1 Tax=Prymnesium parvum TaxID=97485 RepID=A0AB34IY03_PRYPA